MGFHQLFRTINTINPTRWGRARVVALARSAGAIPPSGDFALEPGMSMRIEAGDIDLAIYFRSYELLCTRMLLGRLREGHVFVDVGANIGYYALCAGHRVGPAGRVLAFEPHPATFDKLRHNVELSRASNVSLFRCALADYTGETLLHIHPDPGQHGFCSLKNQGWSGHPTSSVRVRRLDDVLPENLPRCDLIKVDVEGAELALLRGARRTISRYRPAMMVELNEQTARSFGYDSLDIPRLLLKYHADYRFKYIGARSVRAVTLSQMERENLRVGNLLVY